MTWRPTPRKYGNKPITIDGIRFASKKEGYYYLALRDRVDSGEISNLRMQVPYEIVPAVYETQTIHLKTKDKQVTKCVQKAVHYIADFVYTDRDGIDQVIDVKGGSATKTKEYLLKKKMMRAFLGIEIVEV